MSEQWELYVCAMGDKTAYISFDNGVRDELDKVPHVHSVKVRVRIKNPTSAGLPRNEELSALNSVEDAFSSFLSLHGGVFLGRITVGGARYFHSLCDVDETLLGAFCENIHEEHGFNIGYSREPDPERSVYWKDLYPTEDDWQVIRDMKVLDNLKKEGDSLTKKRRVDHWLGFVDSSSRCDFKNWAESNGFLIEGMTERTDDKSFCYWIQIFHEVVPSLAEITHHTIRLNRAAKELLGDYDGWETSVEED